MHVQIVRSGGGEQTCDQRFKLTPVDNIRISHHAFRVKAAHRQQATAQHFRHDIDRVERLLAGANRLHAVNGTAM